MDISKRAERRIYYRPDGQPTGLLRTDGMFLTHYLAKGFTLEPPKEENGDSLSCPTCGFEAKSPFGLQVHLRKHNKI